jgi:hypothetical protein
MPRIHPDAYVVDFQTLGNDEQKKRHLFLRLCYVGYNRHLVIKNYHGIQDKGLYTLATNSPYLKSLALINCSSDPSEPLAIEKGLAHIATQCTQLKELILDHSTLKYIAIQEGASSIHFSSLSVLSVNHCHEMKIISLGNTSQQITLHALDTPQLQDIRTGDNPFEKVPQRLVQLKNQMNDLVTRIQQTKDRKGQWFVDEWKKMDNELQKILLVEVDTVSILIAQHLSLDALVCLWNACSPEEQQRIIDSQDSNDNNILQLMMRNNPIDCLPHMLQLFTPENQYQVLHHQNNANESVIKALFDKTAIKDFTIFFYSLPKETQRLLLDDKSFSIPNALLTREIAQQPFIHWWNETADKKSYKDESLDDIRQRYNMNAFLNRFVRQLKLSDDEVVAFWNQLSPEALLFLFMAGHRENIYFFERMVGDSYPKHTHYLATTLDAHALSMMHQRDKWGTRKIASAIVKQLLVVEKDFKAFLDFWDKIPPSDLKGELLRWSISRGDQSKRFIDEVLTQGGIDGFAHVFQSVSDMFQIDLLTGCHLRTWDDSQSGYEGSSILHVILETKGVVTLLNVLACLPTDRHRIYALEQKSRNGTRLAQSIIDRMNATILKRDKKKIESLIFSKDMFESFYGDSYELLIKAFIKASPGSCQRLPKFIIDRYFFDPTYYANKPYVLDESLPFQSLDDEHFSSHWTTASTEEKEKWAKMTVTYKKDYYSVELLIVDYLLIRDVPNHILREYCIKAGIMSEDIIYNDFHFSIMAHFSDRLSTEDFVLIWSLLSNETREAVSLYRNFIREPIFCSLAVRFDTESFFNIWDRLPSAIQSATAINKKRFNILDYMLSFSILHYADSSKYVKRYWETLSWDAQREIIQFIPHYEIKSFGYQMAQYSDVTVLEAIWQTFKAHQAENTLLWANVSATASEHKESNTSSEFLRGVIRYQPIHYIQQFLTQVKLTQDEWISLCCTTNKEKFCLLDEALLYKPEALTTLLKHLPLEAIQQWMNTSPVQAILISEQLTDDSNTPRSLPFKAKDQSASLYLTVDWLKNKNLVGVHGEGLLHLLAYQGDVKCIQQLLKIGFSAQQVQALLYPDTYRLSPFICAASEGQLDCVKLLFEYDKDFCQESLWLSLLRATNRIPVDRLMPVIDYCLQQGLYPNEDQHTQFKRKGYLISQSEKNSSAVMYLDRQKQKVKPSPTQAIPLKPLHTTKEGAELSLPKSQVQCWVSVEEERDEGNIPWWKQPIADLYEINDQHEQRFKNTLYDAIHEKMVCRDSKSRAQIKTLKELSDELDRLLTKELLNITPKEEAELLRRLNMLEGCQASLLDDIKERLEENRQRAGRPEEVPSNDYLKKNRLNLAYRAKRLDASLEFLTRQGNGYDEKTEFVQVILMGVERNAVQLKPWFDWLTATQCPLEVLDLSENPIGSLYADDKSDKAAQARLQPLLDFLRHNDTITTLKLNNAQLMGTDLEFIMAALEERPIALKQLEVFNNLGLTASNQQLCQSHLSQLDAQVILLEEQASNNDESPLPLLCAIDAECERVSHQSSEEAIDVPQPLNTYSFQQQTFEEIPTPANGHCGFYGLLENPFAVFHTDQETIAHDMDNPFIDGDSLLRLARDKRSEVKQVLLAPFQTAIESKSEENDDDEDISQGDPVKQTLIAEHLQEEVKEFFLQHADLIPSDLQESYALIHSAQDAFDEKEAKLSATLQPYDSELKTNTYRDFVNLPPMEEPYKDLRDYLMMLRDELAADRLPDSDGKLKQQVNDDLEDWQAMLREKQALAEKSSRFYSNPALTKAYIEEVFDGQHQAYLGLHSAYLYGTLSGKGVEIYSLNAQTGTLEIEKKGQLTEQAKQVLSPLVNQSTRPYQLHYTHAPTGHRQNHFTRLVTKGTSIKHLNAIPNTDQQYRKAYRRYYTFMGEIAQNFIPNKAEEVRIKDKIEKEEMLTAKELLKLKAGILSVKLNQSLTIFDPKAQWEILRDAYLNFMPLPTSDNEENRHSPLVRLGKAMLTTNDQLLDFEARESRQQRAIRDIKGNNIIIKSPLNMPLTHKEWALKAQFLQEFNRLNSAANTILSGLVDNDHDLSKTEEAWRCAKAGILGVASFVGGVGELVHTFSNAGRLLHTVIEHSKAAKFASEAFEAFEKIPGIEQAVHTVVHISAHALKKVSKKEFLTTKEKLKNFSKTFLNTTTHDNYLEDLINHFIHDYKEQITILADQEEAAKWGKALAEHTLHAIFAGVALGHEYSTSDNFTHYMRQWIQYIPMERTPTLQTLIHGNVSADTLVKAPIPICQTTDGKRITFQLKPFTINMKEGYTKYRGKKDSFEYPGSDPRYGNRIANAVEVNALQQESKEAYCCTWPEIAEWGLTVDAPPMDQDTRQTLKLIECPWKNPSVLAQQVDTLEKWTHDLQGTIEEMQNNQSQLEDNIEALTEQNNVLTKKVTNLSIENKTRNMQIDALTNHVIALNLWAEKLYRNAKIQNINIDPPPKLNLIKEEDKEDSQVNNFPLREQSIFYHKTAAIDSDDDLIANDNVLVSPTVSQNE